MGKMYWHLNIIFATSNVVFATFLGLIHACTQTVTHPFLTNALLALAVPDGLVVRIRRSHRRGRGSIPRLGEGFPKRMSCCER